MVNLRLMTIIICTFILFQFILLPPIFYPKQSLTFHQSTTTETQIVETKKMTDSQMLSNLATVRDDETTSLSINFSSLLIALAYLGLLVLFLISVRWWKTEDSKNNFMLETKFSTYFDLEFLWSKARTLLLYLEIARFFLFTIFLILLALVTPLHPFFYLTYPLIFFIVFIGRQIEALSKRLTDIQNRLTDLRDHLEGLG